MRLLVMALAGGQPPRPAPGAPGSAKFTMSTLGPVLGRRLGPMNGALQSRRCGGRCGQGDGEVLRILGRQTRDLPFGDIGPARCVLVNALVAAAGGARHRHAGRNGKVDHQALRRHAFAGHAGVGEQKIIGCRPGRGRGEARLHGGRKPISFFDQS